MESGWERRAPPLAPDRAVVLARLARALPGARVERVTPLPGGHCNTNLRVDLEGGRVVVLRLYQRDRDACAREAALLRRVAPVAPVATVLHEDAGGDPPALLLSFCPGRRLCDALPAMSAPEAAAIGRRVGQHLARIHAARAFPRAGFLGPDLEVRAPLDGLGEHLERMLDGRAGARLGREAAAALRRWSAARAGALVGEVVLAHADFKPTNLLVHDDGGWRVTAILDWEFAFAGPRLFDVGQLLRHDEDEVPGPFVAGFEAGYGAVGPPLPDGWRERAAALDLLNLVGFLDDADERPVTQTTSRRLLLRTLARWP